MNLERILVEIEELKYALIGAVEIDEVTRKTLERRIEEIEKNPEAFVEV